MRRLLLVLVFGIAGCGQVPSIPATDVAITVTPSEAEVEFGKAFQLEVVRVWSKDLEVRPFDDGVLAPLVTRHEGTHREEDGRRIRETLRYRAYAFGLENVEIKGPRIVGRPRDGGAKQVAEAVPLRFQVQPVVDPNKPGDPERLHTLYREPRPPFYLLIALGGVLGIFVALLRRPARSRPAPGPSPTEEALRSLRAAGDDVGLMSDVLRERVGRVYDFDARASTRPEILARLAPLEGGADLDAVLYAGVLAKYATWTFDARETARLREQAERVVRAMAEDAS